MKRSRTATVGLTHFLGWISFKFDCQSSSFIIPNSSRVNLIDFCWPPNLSVAKLLQPKHHNRTWSGSMWLWRQSCRKKNVASIHIFGLVTKKIQSDASTFHISWWYKFNKINYWFNISVWEENKKHVKLPHRPSNINVKFYIESLEYQTKLLY